MANVRLVNLKHELSNLPEQTYPNRIWPLVETWIAKARPIFRIQLNEHFVDFEAVTTEPRWPRLAGFIGEEYQRQEWHEIKKTADNAILKILSFLDSIIELQADSDNVESDSHTKIHTGGGASIGRDVAIGKGNFVGRDSQDVKGENIYNIHQMIVHSPNLSPSHLDSTNSDNQKEQSRVESPFERERVALITGNELGNGVKIGGTHHGAPLHIVASGWLGYGETGWVRSGWLHLPSHFGPGLAVAFFKVHMRKDGTGYVHILSAANPVQSIWIQTNSFVQEQSFCWDSDPNVQRTAIWHFRWQ